MLNSLQQVAKKLNIDANRIQIVLDFFKEGSTVPFIARYRKDATGGLDEEQIEAINKDYQYMVTLNKRKESIISLLKETNLLTREINELIIKANTKGELESIYEPFKQGKKTKATEAIALGLEPLAKTIMSSTDENFIPALEAMSFLTDKVKTPEYAIDQSKLIIAQLISQDIKVREIVKHQIKNFGFIKTKKKTKINDEKEKFKLYYDHKEEITKVPSHRVLAMNRGEDLKIISVKLEFNKDKIKEELGKYLFKINKTKIIIMDALEDSLKRMIYPSVEREIRKELFEKAELGAIKLFGNNLEQMLLSPAIKGKIILSIDPAFASGCKTAVLSSSGKVLDISLIKPNAPFNRIKESSEIVNGLLDKFKIDLIVIGNGTASRETESFISTIVKSRSDNIKFAIVSEVGASVYSASKIAIGEFPELSVEQRSAIHIGRKFQDPLNELVKIDPKSIGVGQYQHDVNQKELSDNLSFKVKKVVNKVGVDINTATKEILTYISGLSNKVADNIVLYRLDNGEFKNRKELKKVTGLGAKAFEQSIGFLRIMDSSEFWDKTHVHPESYKLAKSLVKKLDISLDDIDLSKLNVDVNSLSEELEASKYDVELIIEALKAPGKDIRESNDGPLLKSDILTIENLNVGDIMEGAVQNITDFGVFVYIGLKQAALVHISNLSSGFVKHPSEIVKTGEKVSIEIIGIEKERDRIQGKLIK